MDKITLAFIGLLVVLFIGQVFMNENFYNFAGTDTSGNITLSLSDLMSLLGSGTSVTSLTDTKKPVVGNSYKEMRSEIIKDVKQAVKDEMLQKQFSDETTILDDSCIDSFSAQQGSDFMKYIPGKNPDDYIRKDSVPCYGCSIPT